MVLSAEEWLKQQNNTSNQTTPSTNGGGVMSADEWLKSQGKEPIKTTTKKETSKTGDAFRWIGKQLQKPAAITAVQLRGLGEELGNILSIASPKVSAKQGISKALDVAQKTQERSGNILFGKEQTSFSQELASDNKLGLNKIDKAFGIAGDFVVDPLWVTKPVKIAKKVGEVTKLDKPLEVLSKAVSESDKYKALKSIFSTKTGDKAFDATVNKFRDLAQYREGQFVQDAINIQKDIKAVTKSGIKNAEELITEGLENPASLEKITNKTILDTVNKLKNTYKGLLDESKKVGLSINEIKDYAPHIITKEALTTKLANAFKGSSREFGIGQIEKGRKLEGTIKGLAKEGIDIFEKNPAVQLAKKGQAYAKAITAKEFANEISKFAIKDGIEATNPLVKGLKFTPEQVKVIDNFYQGIKPEELNVVLKVFDKVQNIWKAQALVAPSYHIRNIAGNLWNNFLAGVNPGDYARALAIQTGKTTNKVLLEEIPNMRKLGVIGEGWYAADIADEITKNVGKSVKQGLNPFSQQNYLFQANKKVGTAIEDNARIAHYLSKRAAGLAPEEAAMSVKKYLFDYADLTKYEKGILKRVIPFYTWTRKNIPLQLEGLITQPAKFALPQKIITQIENSNERPNEKFMGDYIKSNIPVRLGKDENGNTVYFMLGNWLPYAQAVDVLSQPFSNLIAMASPFIKAPAENYFGQSTFFKNTLGEKQDIERYYKEQGEFLGTTMRKKNIALLRNIRILNEIDKWIDKNDPTATKDSWQAKFMNFLFGKTATYDVNKSRYFYNLDTEQRKQDLQNSIKNALKKQDKEKAKALQQELRDFLKSR